MNTLSFSQLGKLGRLGNQLFQIASTMGVAIQNAVLPVFPSWPYERYFENALPHGDMNTVRVSEKGFEYSFITVEPGTDLFGYLQSEKYWKSSKENVLSQLKFRQDFEEHFTTRSFYARVFEKEVTAVHIRRGDYVGNENYFSLPPSYYNQALQKFFPNIHSGNILVFSDDIEYAKMAMDTEKLKNVYFSEGQSEIDDLCMMSLCTNFVIANSSFSWWGAYLGTSKKPGTVIRPVHHFAGPLAERANTDDLYPAEWVAFDHMQKEISDKKIDIAMHGPFPTGTFIDVNNMNGDLMTTGDVISNPVVNLTPEQVEAMPHTLTAEKSTNGDNENVVQPKKKKTTPKKNAKSK